MLQCTAVCCTVLHCVALEDTPEGLLHHINVYIHIQTYICILDAIIFQDMCTYMTSVHIYIYDKCTHISVCNRFMCYVRTHVHKEAIMITLMMMIAVISIQSGVVPLIEGPCAQIYSGFEIIGGFAFTSFAFLFRKKNHVEEKSSQSKIASYLLAYTYTCVLCTYIRIHIYRDLVHLDSSGLPGVSCQPLGSQPSTPYVQCVRVCVYTHTYTHIHSPPR